MDTPSKTLDRTVKPSPTPYRGDETTRKPSETVPWIRVACPQCRMVSEGRLQLARGATIRCPRCQSTFSYGDPRAKPESRSSDQLHASGTGSASKRNRPGIK